MVIPIDTRKNTRTYDGTHCLGTSIPGNTLEASRSYDRAGDSNFVLGTSHATGKVSPCA